MLSRASAVILSFQSPVWFFAVFFSFDSQQETEIPNSYMGWEKGGGVVDINIQDQSYNGKWKWMIHNCRTYSCNLLSRFSIVWSKLLLVCSKLLRVWSKRLLVCSKLLLVWSKLLLVCSKLLILYMWQTTPNVLPITGTQNMLQTAQIMLHFSIVITTTIWVSKQSLIL